MRIVIAGAGTIGSHVAEMLQAEHHDICVIDPNEEQLESIEDLDIQTITRLGA